jgi:SPP1 gp7 family putative phage head morphogenesis protein
VANLFTRALARFAKVEPLESRSKQASKPSDDVATYERAQISLGPRYTPDSLVRSKGIGIYEKMRLDEQVKAVMNFKRDAITARGWTFKYEDESSLSDTERVRRIRVFNEIFCKMRGSFVDALNVVATGRDYGFSLTEKVYSDVTIDGQTYIGLNMLLGRDPSTFEFYTDEYGILQKVVQLAAGRRIDVDMSRMIHYVHSPEFDRFYGRSDLREAYRAWFIKQRVGEFWALYLERMAGGFLVLNPKEEDPAPEGTAAADSLHQLLTNLHGSSGIKLMPGYEVQLIQPATTDAFEKAMVFWDLAIAKALLVPNLLGISHTGQTGAFAQSQTQLEAFFWTLNADSERLEATINEQLVKDLGDQNFGDGDYPEFCFKPASREHIKQVIADWKTLTDAKAVIATTEDEEHFRKLLDMPKRDETSEPLIDPVVQQNQDMAQNGQSFDQKMRANQDARAQAEADRQAKAENAARMAEMSRKLDAITETLTSLRPAGEVHQHTRVNGAHSPADGSQAVPHGPLRNCTRAQFDRAAQRVAFTVIENRQDRMAADLTTQVAQFVAKGTKKLLGSDDDLSKLIDNDPTDIAAVEFNGVQKGKLKDLYRRSLSSAWTLGGSLARNELERARGQRLVRMKDLRDTAADYFEVNGFRMAGNVSDGVRAIIQQELQNSVKFGRTPGDTRQVIWDRLVSRGFTSREAALDAEDDPQVSRALKDLWGVSEKQTASYLDTLSRTNLFEAMNEARYAEFTDPELGGFVVALQYSAILDDRTTDICQALNGQTYAEDSDVWDQYRPPNHFNCRSVLIPVTELDGWDGQESPPPSVQPQAGFGGTLQ